MKLTMPFIKQLYPAPEEPFNKIHTANCACRNL